MLIKKTIIIVLVFMITMRTYETTSITTNKKIIGNTNEEYIGIIEIENKKIYIKNGTQNNIIDQNVVGFETNSSNLNSIIGHSILAGHNIDEVFKILHKTNSDIKIYYQDKIYTYEIISKNTIDVNDFEIFKIDSQNKYLSLITCTNDNNKRLVVLTKSKAIYNLE